MYSRSLLHIVVNSCLTISPKSEKHGVDDGFRRRIGSIGLSEQDEGATTGWTGRQCDVHQILKGN